MNPRLQRAALLLDQSRHDLAEQELRLALADDPNDALCHALLARCLAVRKQFQEATDEARQAVHLAPDNAYMHYCLSLVLEDRNHLPEAQAAIEEAIRLDPYNADYFARLAALHFNRRNWQAARGAAEQGLAIDAEHAGCTNLRAMALVKLGRKDLAAEAIGAALARNPEDAYAHANQGWTLIEQGRHAEALDHFKEALRIDSEMAWAREGIVEALRARYFVYRIMLGWFLWMQKLSSGAQWGIILGLYVAYQVLRRAADANPAIGPFVMPLLVAYSLFAFMTWISRPAFNLVLRLSRFGRLALSREEIITSNWVGLLLLGGVLLLGAFLVTASPPFLWAALACGLSVPAVSTVYLCECGWPRVAMACIAAGVFLCGEAVAACMFAAPRVPPEYQQFVDKLAENGAFVFVFAAVASQFAAMALAQVRVRR